MNGRWRTGALVAAIGLQLAVLAGELLGAVYPHWVGAPVRLAVEPVDPRSLFRGNYAQLSYRIGNLALPADQVPPGLRSGEQVYLELRPGPGDLMEAGELRREPPDTGPFIRGRVVSLYRSARPTGDETGDRQAAPEDSASRLQVRLRYGIEAYFLPRDKAIALQDALRSGHFVANVMLAPNGRAALRDVSPATPRDPRPGS